MDSDGSIVEHDGGAPDSVGTVVEQLPSALYRVRMDEGPAVVAHIGGRPGGDVVRNFVRVLVGDRVRVERSPVDLGRGRIVERIG